MTITITTGEIRQMAELASAKLRDNREKQGRLSFEDEKLLRECTELVTAPEHWEIRIDG